MKPTYAILPSCRNVVDLIVCLHLINVSKSCKNMRNGKYPFFAKNVFLQSIYHLTKSASRRHIAVFNLG